MNKYLHKKLLLPLFLPACLISSWFSDYIVNFNTNFTNSEIKEKLSVKNSEFNLNSINKENNLIENDSLFLNSLNLFHLVNLVFVLLIFKSAYSRKSFYIFFNKQNIKKQNFEFNNIQKYKEKAQNQTHFFITSLKKPYFSQYYSKLKESY